MRVSEFQSMSQLPWQATLDEFTRAAADVTEGGACCVFVIDDSIPASARSGYAALVIAYARADEPVCILNDGGAALLVRSGGVESGVVVARRVLEQMRRLALEKTLRAGVSALESDAAHALEAAKAQAASAAPGEVAVAHSHDD
jgi:hypothetical protein